LTVKSALFGIVAALHFQCMASLAFLGGSHWLRSCIAHQVQTALQFSAMEGQGTGSSAGLQQGWEHQRGQSTGSNPSSNEKDLFQVWGSQGWESYGKVHQTALREAWAYWNSHGASVEEAAAACVTLTDGHVNFKVQLGCLAEYHSLHADVVGWQERQDGGDKRWVRLIGFGGANDIWEEMIIYSAAKLCQPCGADNKPLPKQCC
jgi:hypothetical protein